MRSVVPCTPCAHGPIQAVTVPPLAHLIRHTQASHHVLAVLAANPNPLASLQCTGQSHTQINALNGGLLYPSLLPFPPAQFPASQWNSLMLSADTEEFNNGIPMMVETAGEYLQVRGGVAAGQ